MAAPDSQPSGNVHGSVTGEHPDFERYRVPQNVAANLGRILVRNDRGQAVFELDVGTQTIADIVRVRALTGGAACVIPGRALLGGNIVEILDLHQETLAAIERGELSPVRDCFTVLRGSKAPWRVDGRVVDYEYLLWEQDVEIAEVSRRWFRARDSFGVQVTAGQPDLLVMSVAVCLDLIVHAGR